MNEFDKWLHHPNSPGKWEHQLPPWKQVCSGNNWRAPSELIAVLSVTSIFVAGAGVSLAVFELIRYLIRKRRAANIVLLDPSQAEIEIWKVDDRRYEQAKARLLQRQKDRGEDS